MTYNIILVLGVQHNDLIFIYYKIITTISQLTIVLIHSYKNIFSCDVDIYSLGNF